MKQDHPHEGPSDLDIIRSAEKSLTTELQALRIRTTFLEGQNAELRGQRPTMSEEEKGDTLRGHPIYQDKDGTFRFVDNDKPTQEDWFNRPCGHCGLTGNSNDGLPDPCLGVLPGVTNACCGHGDPSSSYVCFKGGVVLRGFHVDTSAQQS